MTEASQTTVPGQVSLGVSLYDVSPARLVEVAKAADGAGFETLWLGEHLIDPGSYGSVHPTHDAANSTDEKFAPDDFRSGRIVESSTQLVDPMVALAAVAAQTSRIRIATGIYLLPLRHPLVTARAAATLQAIAGGRFMLGVGAGWLREEFAALGVPFAERAGRLDESIAVLRRAWAGGRFDHHGKHFDFCDVAVCAEPVNISLVTGGNSPAALQRAASVADGWFSSATPDFEQAVALRDSLAKLSEAQGRSVECHVRVRSTDPALVSRYVEAGFTSLVFWAQDVSPPGANANERFCEVADNLQTVITNTAGRR